MAWTAPTPDDVMSEFTPSEVATINSLLQGGATVTTKLSAILSRTVAEIRGYINSGDYPVDPNSEATVPPSLMTDTIAITRWRFLIAAPQLKQLQTEERKDAMLQSLAKLIQVGNQQFVPEPPVDTTMPHGGVWNSENKIIMRTHPTPKPATQWTPQTDAYANPDAPQDAQATP